VGLLTGNTPEGARLKLEHFGIAHHFPFGGYGEHHPERDGVARDALAAAQAHVQRTIPTERVWVIGDTPLDIRCARHIGAKAVAVATGQHPREELAAETPDLLLDDLGQAAPLLELIEDAG
jgi:phosphoglycolate phosphatase